MFGHRSRLVRARPARGSSAGGCWTRPEGRRDDEDPAGRAIAVDVFESLDLPDHWARLDDFEGPGYRRVVTTVRTATGDVEASSYVLKRAQV